MSPRQSSLLAPDVIIVNAIVQTMDPAQPQAEAVAVIRDRIAAVGSTAEIRSLAGPTTRVIDAQQRLLLPGFNDAHVHFLMGGFQLSNVDLRDAKSPAEFAQRLHDFAATKPPGSWIIGGEWDHESWPDAPLPAKELIDAATPHHPVFVARLDGHMGLANSVALKLAGVDRHTPEVAAGKIVRDHYGNPTGLLKDAAMAYVEKLIPQPTFDEKLAAARAATRYAASLGVTSVQDMSTGTDISVYQTLAERDELLTRIYGMNPLATWERLAATGIRAPFGNDLLRLGGMKAFSDGSLGSNTALFFDPYLTEPDNCGLPGPDAVPEGILLQRVLAADRAGFQVIVHAIGDRANAGMLDIFEHVAATNGPRDRRFRIEHAQHLRPSDIPRFVRERVIASMQPYHAIDDARWCEPRLGPERCRGAYAIKSLQDSGTTLAFGSDWTVAPLDPLTGIYAAVTRRSLDGKHPGGWHPEQKITVAETVRAYTVGSAYTEFTEQVKGSLTPGKLADLVLLDKNIFTIDPGEILDTRAILTMMGGRIIHDQIS